MAELLSAGPRPVIVDVLVIIALMVITIAAIGLIRTENPITRLHFVAPTSTLALPCFGLAAIIEEGFRLGSAAIALAIAAGALSAPVLTIAIARVITAEARGASTPEQTR